MSQFERANQVSELPSNIPKPILHLICSDIVEYRKKAAHDLAYELTNPPANNRINRRLASSARLLRECNALTSGCALSQNRSDRKGTDAAGRANAHS